MSSSRQAARPLPRDARLRERTPARSALALVSLFALVAITPSSARAHVPLGPGDLVIVGVRSGAPDTVLVLALVPLHVGDGIVLTDDGLRADGTLRRVEGSTYFDVDRTTYPPGTLLALQAGSMSLDRASDQIIVYRGAVDGAGALSGEWIWALGWGLPFGAGATSNQDSALPAALDGRFTELPVGALDMAYVGPTAGTASAIRALVADPSNWSVGAPGTVAFPTSFDVRIDRGGPCVVDGECVSGDFCVDGTCCNTTCSRERFGHCFGCWFGIADPRNGTCGAAATTQLCRVGRGVCDPQETCDGVLTTCPSDRRAEAGTVCRASRDTCDLAERCDGVAVGCPSDGAMPFGAVCRPAAGACDLVERCSGASFTCPDDDAAPDDTACGSCGGVCSAGVCDERCPDAGLDGSIDDAGATEDDGGAVEDAGATDAGWDAGHDASVLVRADAPRDADRQDAGPPARLDAAEGMDAGTDASPTAASSCSASPRPGDALPLLSWLALLGIQRWRKRTRGAALRNG